MKVFWDANVLMDLFDQARPGHSDAVKLLKQTQQVAATNLCAWHSLSILSYLCAKKFGKTSADEIIQELLKVFEIPATGSVQAQRAFVYNSHDYEDALQISSAVEGHADYLVSRDTKGFRRSPIAVVSPKKIISVLSKQ